MCGILFVDLDGVQITDRRNIYTLSHRGPDAHAELVVGADAGAGKKGHLLSFDRLAIVSCDPKGMQPFTVGGDGIGGIGSIGSIGSISMICSGEIYNFKDVFENTRDVQGIKGIKGIKGINHPFPSDTPLSDCDIVLRVLADKLDRPDEVARVVGGLDGDFAFVVTDGTRVVAGRDPFGVRPLFYGTDNESKIVAFASEAKALTCIPGLHEVKVFPPGFIYSSTTGLEETWVNTGLGGAPTHVEDLAPPITVFELLTEAVRKRIDHSDQEEVAVLCSGGIDSAAIACIAASLVKGQTTNKGVRLFTMRYRTGHSDDAFYAGLLCKSLRLKHDTLEFGPEDLNDATIEAVVNACETKDPNTVRAAIPMYILARKIREKAPGIKVVLSGEGADELFGGYGYFRFAPTPKDASTECDRLLKNLHMFDLLRADRCFAAHGLEVRVPFLDQDLVRYVGSLPGGVRVAGEKQLLRDAVAEFDELVRSRILDRAKEKFSDGAGFSYVPDLLRRLSMGRDDGTLATRLRAESAAYAAMFEKSYGSGNWVVERELPSWSGLAEARSAGEAGGGLMS